MSPTPPVIPGYTLHHLLGRGGMAEVWLATQDSLQRQVAIKLLLDTRDEQLARRFTREAHTVAALRHPAIVTIHDIALLPDGRPWLSMEFLGGGDLTRYRGQALPPDEATAILRQAAEGLAIVHDKGLVHRDIKPANLLFRDDGQLVISDFGIARPLDADSDLTQEGIAVGSPAYSSPEQSQGLPVDGRADLYSLGVVFAELLTGRNPYKGDSYAQTVSNHLTMDIPVLPPALRRFQPVLDRLLAREPADRFPDARALLAALDAIPNSEPSSATRQPAAPKTVPRALIAGLAALALLGGGALAWKPLTLWHTLHQADRQLEAGHLTGPDSADALYRDVLQHDPANTRAQAGLAKVRTARAAQAVQRGETRLAEGKVAEPAKDSALSAFREALAIEPGNAAAKAGLHRIAMISLGLAKAAREEGRMDEAKKQLRTGLDAEPDEPGLLALKAAQEKTPETAEAEASSSGGKSRAGRRDNAVSRFFRKLWH